MGLIRTQQKLRAATPSKCQVRTSDAKEPFDFLIYCLAKHSLRRQPAHVHRCLCASLGPGPGRREAPPERQTERRWRADGARIPERVRSKPGAQPGTAVATPDETSNEATHAAIRGRAAGRSRSAVS